MLDAAETSHSTPSDTIPLPLSDRIWIDVVFKGRATPQTLVSSILQSRTAALFYCGLLSLDDETRAWLAGQRNLIAELASSRAGAFVAAAPGLRIVSGAVRPIGGELAAPVWEALVGEPLDQPVDFVRALVSRNHGYLAHFFGTIGQLTPSQIRVALNLEAATVPARTDSAQRLYRVFHAQWGGGTIEHGAFTRPTLDPALLVADLTSDGSGRPQVPGTRGLWRAVFDSADASRGPVTLDAPARDRPGRRRPIFRGCASRCLRSNRATSTAATRWSCSRRGTSATLRRAPRSMSSRRFARPPIIPRSRERSSGLASPTCRRSRPRRAGPPRSWRSATTAVR